MNTCSHPISLPVGECIRFRRWEWSEELVAQSCPTLCNPVDCNCQAPLSMEFSRKRILEWVAIPSSRGSSQPRDRTCVFCICCFGRQIFFFFTTVPPEWEGQKTEKTVSTWVQRLPREMWQKAWRQGRKGRWGKDTPVNPCWSFHSQLKKSRY